jgi:pimeloyl-ACP methyl ester carboxylesterase
MHRKSWRYYRDSTIVWASFFLLLFSAGYALRHPIYWILVLLVWFIRSPLRRAFYHAHPPRRISWLEKTALQFREVTFKSRDGLTLFGRFVPGRNKATILLVHDLGQAGQDMLFYAEFLANAGFGIFTFDLRAHGSSDGDTSTNGLCEAEDVAGAVDYLIHRIDVNGQRIGMLGIGLGAQAVLRGALQVENTRAMVLEGLEPSALSDHGGSQKSFIRQLSTPANWLYYKLYEFMCRGRQAGVLDVIGELAPRPLLLIASGSQDIYFNRFFYRAAGEPRELWEVPQGEHGAAILANSHAYIERMKATQKVQRSGGPDKTATWIWLDPARAGLKLNLMTSARPPRRCSAMISLIRSQLTR